ncbi:phosphatase PAP2 family protein [Rufibacter psychrotolerans]|uniref:phosphatase PAP2 family protein n=1 Tax=Rufibacter psychrotolerans TaxID=2812556 RepID=UPI001966F6DF|nr:phosphatase PAP2 family protein [Rufibacter sp. SYSU D00308]
MRSLLLVLALLFVLRTTGSAAMLPPDTVRSFSDTTFSPPKPELSWAKKHRRLLLRSSSALVATGLFIASYQQFDRSIHKLTQANRTALSNGTARLVEPMGTAVPLHATFATMFTIGALAKRPKMREAALVGLGSLYANSLLTDQLKKAFQRHRPSTTNDNQLFEGADGDGKNTSFPSSHTSNAFAAATAIASVYRDSRWVPQVAYGVATLVGLSRIHDNKHWASDVLAGAAVGYLTGKATFWGYHQLKGKLTKPRWLVTPSWQRGQTGLSASLRF